MDNLINFILGGNTAIDAVSIVRIIVFMLILDMFVMIAQAALNCRF